MRSANLLFPFVLLVSVGSAVEPPPITMPQSGYTIGVLDPGLAPFGGFESIRMLLPPKGGFASNINIQHQSFPGSLNDYATTSEAGAKKANLAMINAKVEKGAYTAEAVGQVPGTDIEVHFYFKAIKSGDNVILATAAIPTSRWETEKQILVPIVNSLTPASK